MNDTKILHLFYKAKNIHIYFFVTKKIRPVQRSSYWGFLAIVGLTCNRRSPNLMFFTQFGYAYLVEAITQQQ